MPPPGSIFRKKAFCFLPCVLYPLRVSTEESPSPNDITRRAGALAIVDEVRLELDLLIAGAERADLNFEG